MLKVTCELLARGYARAGVATTLALAPLGVFAQEANPISDLLDGVDLAGVATKVAAVAVTIVAIALAIKGPSIAKRLISRI